MDHEVSALQKELRSLEESALEKLSDIRDPDLDTPTSDGRSVRDVIYELSDHYREHIEQLLWAKWGQQIPRSESKRSLAELQGLRAQFAAYFAELQDSQLDASSHVADKASPREIINHVMSEESEAIALVHNALEDQNSEGDGNG